MITNDVVDANTAGYKPNTSSYDRFVADLDDNYDVLLENIWGSTKKRKRESSPSHKSITSPVNTVPIEDIKESVKEPILHIKDTEESSIHVSSSPWKRYVPVTQYNNDHLSFEFDGILNNQKPYSSSSSSSTSSSSSSLEEDDRNPRWDKENDLMSKKSNEWFIHHFGDSLLYQIEERISDRNSHPEYEDKEEEKEGEGFDIDQSLEKFELEKTVEKEMIIQRKLENIHRWNPITNPKPDFNLPVDLFLKSNPDPSNNPNPYITPDAYIDGRFDYFNGVTIARINLYNRNRRTKKRRPKKDPLTVDWKCIIEYPIEFTRSERNIINHGCGKEHYTANVEEFMEYYPPIVLNPLNGNHSSMGDSLILSIPEDLWVAIVTFGDFHFVEFVALSRTCHRLRLNPYLRTKLSGYLPYKNLYQSTRPDGSMDCFKCKEGNRRSRTKRVLPNFWYQLVTDRHLCYSHFCVTYSNYIQRGRYIEAAHPHLKEYLYNDTRITFFKKKNSNCPRYPLSRKDINKRKFFLPELVYYYVRDRC